MKLRLRYVEGRYGIARLGPDVAVPDWADGLGFCSVTRADDELTVVCLEARIPDDVEADRGWICLRTVGPFAFDASGVVLALIEPLSSAGVGVFVQCTFDGEHLLIAAGDQQKAERLLTEAGHELG